MVFNNRPKEEYLHLGGLLCHLILIFFFNFTLHIKKLIIHIKSFLNFQNTLMTMKTFQYTSQTDWDIRTSFKTKSKSAVILTRVMLCYVKYSTWHTLQHTVYLYLIKYYATQYTTLHKMQYTWLLFQNKYFCPSFVYDYPSNSLIFLLLILVNCIVGCVLHSVFAYFFKKDLTSRKHNEVHWVLCTIKSM